MVYNILLSLALMTTTAPASAPLECIYAATPAVDRQAIGGLSARGGGQRTQTETDAINRLQANDQACTKTHKWPAARTKAALDYARALFLRDFGRTGLTARKLPPAIADNIYAKMTPAMRTTLLAGSLDPAVNGIMINEFKRAGLKPGQVTRDDTRLIGNILAAMASADKAQATFTAS